MNKFDRRKTERSHKYTLRGKDTHTKRERKREADTGREKKTTKILKNFIFIKRKNDEQLNAEVMVFLQATTFIIICNTTLNYTIFCSNYTIQY